MIFDVRSRLIFIVFPIIFCLLTFISSAVNAEPAFRTGIPPDSIGGLRKELNKIDLENAEMLPIYDFRLEELKLSADKILAIFKSPGKNSAYADTAGIKGFYKEYRFKRQTLDQYLSSMDYRLCLMADRKLAEGDTVKAIDLCKQAVTLNRFFIPASIKLTALYIRTGQLDNSAGIALDTEGMIYPNSHFYSLYINMLTNVYDAFLSAASHLYDNESYNEALEVYTKAEEFCKHLKENICDDRLKAGIKEAKTGVCKSIFNIAGKALENGFESIALKYSFQGRKYIRDNGIEQKAAGFADEFLVQYTGYYIEKGKQAKKEKDQNLSGFYFNKALAAADSITNSHLRQSISHIISSLMPHKRVSVALNKKEIKPKKNINKQEKANTKHLKKVKKEEREEKMPPVIVTPVFSYLDDYKSMLDSATSMLKHYSYDSALNVLDQAWKIRKEHSIKDTAIVNLTAECIKPSLSRKVSDIFYEIWKNNLDTVNRMLTELRTELINYELGSRPEFLTAFNSIDKKIAEKLCENKQNQFGSWLIKARLCIKNQQYIDAMVLLDTAVAMKFPQQYCHPDTSEACSLIRKYRFAAIYQQKIKNSFGLFGLKDYLAAVSKYYEAESLFYEKHLLDLGIIHVSLQDFAVNTKDIAFMAYVSNYLSGAGKCYESLRVLQGMRNAGCTKNESEQTQLTTAKCIIKAITGDDFKNNPENEFIKLNVEDEWFSPFRKAYLQELKKLRKKD